jgi:hypothetical protein
MMMKEISLNGKRVYLEERNKALYLYRLTSENGGDGITRMDILSFVRDNPSNLPVFFSTISPEEFGERTRERAVA